MIDTDIILRLIILSVLIAVSAFFSACETAFFSLSRFRVETMKEKGKWGSDLAASLLEKPRSLLITIYLGNDFTNVAISAVVSSICIYIFGDRGLSIAIGIATFLLLVFGDITPKTFAIKNNENVARLFAYPLKIFFTLIFPIQTIFTAITNRVINTFVGKREDSESAITEEELMTLIDIGEEEGSIKTEEKELIQSVFEMGDLKTEEIMTQRDAMFSIEINTGIQDVISKIKNVNYSRIPVYEEGIDNIAGILYTKDLMKYTYCEQKNLPNLREILHPPFFVENNKRVNELLKDFQRKKIHIAIVRDSNGKVAGLITMEDVLTELVGEI